MDERTALLNSSVPDATADSLLGPVSVRTLLARRATYRAATGVDETNFYVDPIAPFALPVATGARFRGLASFLDCPKAWLPAELLDRRDRTAPRSPTAGTRLRAAATAAAFVRAELWHPTRGFTPVGSRYGIHFDCPDILLRAAAWQAGSRDRIFDRIERDLHNLMRSNTNVTAAESLMPAIRDRQRVIMAELLEETAHAASGPAPRDELLSVIAVAIDTVGDLPSGRHRVADDLLAAASRISTAPHRAPRPLLAIDATAAAASINDALRPHARGPHAAAAAMPRSAAPSADSPSGSVVPTSELPPLSSDGLTTTANGFRRPSPARTDPTQRPQHQKGATMWFVLSILFPEAALVWWLDRQQRRENAARAIDDDRSKSEASAVQEGAAR